MSARGELADLIWEDAAADRVKDGTRASLVPVVRSKVEAMADKILAAGYRKPRTITTAEELDALPENTAIIGISRAPKHWPGTPYVKLSDATWHDYGNDYSVDSNDILLPATITFEPEPQP